MNAQPAFAVINAPSLKLDARTHQGKVQPSNEDCVAVGEWRSKGDAPTHSCQQQLSSHPLLLAVADGMSDFAGGDVASERVLKMLQSTSWSNCDEATARRALQRAQADLAEQTLLTPELKDMGSTVAGALISGRHLFFFNVGDSRVYHQRNGQLKQLSTDDRMGASGMLMQSLVAQDLNINALMDVHHGQRVLRNGDVLLLCTDGLTDVLSDTEIEQALAQPGAADTLVLLALERGAPGNVSCVVAVVEDAAH